MGGGIHGGINHFSAVSMRRLAFEVIRDQVCLVQIARKEK